MVVAGNYYDVIGLKSPDKTKDSGYESTGIATQTANFDIQPEVIEMPKKKIKRKVKNKLSETSSKLPQSL